MPQDAFRAVCDAWTANSGRERTTTLIYSVGWTQHSVGAQYIRAGSIVQLLLGNIGRPGGGILALRGHASIQGSTDIPTLFNLLPGYLPMPSPATPDLDAYVASIRSRKQKGFWYAADAYMISLLKEYWGEGATADNDYRFDYLPRIDGDHGVFRTALDMVEGKVPGYFLFGQNPAVAVSNGRLMRLAMAQLDWMVVRDLAMIETATFWKDAPEVDTGEIVPEECRTEVFFFPAASHVEKEGTFTQTERMLQWRERAVEPAADQRSDLWFTYHLGRIIRERLADSADERDRPIVELNWDLPVHGDPVWGEPDAEEVLRRINGYHLDTGELVADYRHLKADGSHVVGLLDLHRGVQGRGEPLRAARRRPRRQVGLVLAAGPPRALQPGLGRSGREAVERAQEAGLVGRRRPPLGGRRHPRLPRRPPARPRPTAATPSARPRCAATTRSSSKPTGRPGCSRPTAWSTGPCRRTTSPTSRRCATRCTGRGRARPGGGTSTPRTRPTPRRAPCSRSC